MYKYFVIIRCLFAMAAQKFHVSHPHSIKWHDFLACVDVQYRTSNMLHNWMQNVMGNIVTSKEETSRRTDF